MRPSGPCLEGHVQMSSLTFSSRSRRRMRWSGLAAALLAGSALAGCAVGEGGMVEIMAPPAPAVDSALAALSRGRLAEAEDWSARALAANPRDPYALLIQGMLAERAGQPEVAREAYAAILALKPDATIDLTPLDMDTAPRPLTEIAAGRMNRLPPAPVRSGFARVPGVTGPTAMETPAPGPAQGADETDPVWETISQRFEIMKRLYADSLITDVEYSDRRAENRGALLPLTQPPPSAGLSRPAPRATAVAGRLRDLANSFERGAISARDHAEERRAILDAMLPADPLLREQADMRPKSPRAVESMGRRLEDALRRGLITPDEYEAERAALRRIAMEQAPGRADRLLPPPSQVPSADEGASEQPGAESETPDDAGADDRDADQGGMDQSDTDQDGTAGSETGVFGDAPRPLLPVGPPTATTDDPATQRFTGVTTAPADGIALPEEGQPASRYVHLASYRDMDSARAGWEALSGHYAGMLRDMSPHFEAVTIPGKGRFIRVKAGPVATAGGPARLCDRLQAAGQFCAPTTLEP